MCRLPLDDPAEWARAIAERAAQMQRPSPMPQENGKNEENGADGAGQSSLTGGSGERKDSGAAIGAQLRAPDRDRICADAVRDLTDAGYEIHSAALRMQELYLQLAGDDGTGNV